MMKNKISRITIISSWIFSLIAILCSFLRVDVHITHETFIGVIAALIGVIATFIVGFQIYNVIENNAKLKEYESSQNKIRVEILQNKRAFAKNLKALENQIKISSSENNKRSYKHKCDVNYLKSQIHLHTSHLKISDWNSLLSTTLKLDKDLNDDHEAFIQFLQSENIHYYLDLIDAQQNNKSISLNDNLHMGKKIIDRFDSNLKKIELSIKSISPDSSHTLNLLVQKIKKLRTATNHRYNSFLEKYGEYI